MIHEAAVSTKLGRPWCQPVLYLIDDTYCVLDIINKINPNPPNHSVRLPASGPYLNPISCPIPPKSQRITWASSHWRSKQCPCPRQIILNEWLSWCIVRAPTGHWQKSCNMQLHTQFRYKASIPDFSHNLHPMFKMTEFYKEIAIVHLRFSFTQRDKTEAWTIPTQPLTLQES
jgi:hypothetical protein